MATNSDYDKAYATITAALASNPSTVLFTEPASPADPDHPPLYPYNQIIDSESGHSLQLDDTPGRERVCIQHGKSKNFIEMHPNGDQVVKVFGENFDITIGKKNVYVSGACNIIVKGNCSMQVDGDFNQEVNGDYNLAVKGKMNMRVVKDFSIQGDSDVEIGANERFGGSLRFSSGQSLDLVSDLYVSGSINCDSLTAESRVNAGMGVYAGPFGFTSSLGGLSLGRPTPFTPVASPGCIDIIGSVTALGSVNAPVGNFLKTNVGLATNGISTSILGADLINDIIYNLHIHFTPKGPSSPTPTGMVA